MDLRAWLQQQQESTYVPQDRVSYQQYDAPVIGPPPAPSYRPKLNSSPDRRLHPAHAHAYDEQQPGRLAVPGPAHAFSAQFLERQSRQQHLLNRSDLVSDYVGDRDSPTNLEAFNRPPAPAKQNTRFDQERLRTYRDKRPNINEYRRINEQKHVSEQENVSESMRRWALADLSSNKRSEPEPNRKRKKEEGATADIVGPFQRRARRKTREAIYEFGAGVRRRKHVPAEERKKKTLERDDSRKIGNYRKHKAGRGMRLLNDFNPPNVFSDRVTIDQRASLGLFAKGRASSPVNGRKLADAAFSELEFLRQNPHSNDHNTIPIPERQSRKNSQSDTSDSEIAAYFSRKRQTLASPELRQMPRSDVVEGDVPATTANPDDDMLDQGPSHQEMLSEGMHLSSGLARRKRTASMPVEVAACSETPLPWSSSDVSLHHPSPERVSKDIGARMNAEALRASRKLPNPKGLFDADVMSTSSHRSRGQESLGIDNCQLEWQQPHRSSRSYQNNAPYHSERCWEAAPLTTRYKQDCAKNTTRDGRQLKTFMHDDSNQHISPHVKKTDTKLSPLSAWELKQERRC